MSFFKDLLGIAAPVVGGLFGGPVGAAVGTAVGGFVGADKQKKAMQQAGRAATPTPWSTFGPLGNVISQNGSLSFQMADNPFFPMFQNIGMANLANALTAPGSPYYGAAPEIAAAAAGMDPEAMQGAAQSRYNLLTQLAQPQENRAFQALEDRLFARGQMGTSGGGEQYRAFEEARQQADLSRQLAGQDWARTTALDRFNTALGAVGSGQAGQLQQWNIGTGGFNNLQNAMMNLLQQGNVGVSAGAGMPANIAMGIADARVQPYVGLQTAVGQAAPAIGEWLKGKWESWRTPPFNPNAPDVNWQNQMPAVGGFFG